MFSNFLKHNAILTDIAYILGTTSFPAGEECRSGVRWPGLNLDFITCQLHVLGKPAHLTLAYPICNSEFIKKPLAS